MSVSSDFARFDPDASRRGVGDDAPLPAHASPTYYERPLLKLPHWETDVIVYLFLGGVMGGTGMLLAVADENGEDAELARVARYLAFALATACPAVLISHLGRPERFLNMMRIVKFKSPMSMGVWGLIAFSLPASAAAAAQAVRDGLVPLPFPLPVPRMLTNVLTAAFGAFIAGYTGVLISATAVPLWGKGKRHIPAFSVCSGVAGACAANGAVLALLRGDTHRSRAKLERLELIAGLAELALLLDFRRHARELGTPMFSGPRGAKLQTWTMGAGILGSALVGLFPGHARWKSLVAGVLTLAGGYVLRETLIESGKASSQDPRAAARQPE